MNNEYVIESVNDGLFYQEVYDCYCTHISKQVRWVIFEDHLPMMFSTIKEAKAKINIFPKNSAVIREVKRVLV